MSKHFTSVLKVGSSLQTQSLQERDKPKKIGIENAKSITLQHPQPHPHSSSELVNFVFDRVFSEGDSDLYKHSVKEVVENTLLGYHGTVISLCSSHTTDDKASSLRGGKNGMISKAASQLFRCLKKSRSSKSSSSTANLVVLCSFVLLVDENAHDLLLRFSSEGLPPEGLDFQPPQLSVVNGNIMRVSQEEVKTTSKVMTLLTYGTQMEERILVAYGKTKADKVSHHHSILTLTVEYAQFGSMNAPVSGNLSFVDIAATDPLAHRPKYTTGDTISKSVQSLFTFADTVTGLTSNIGVLSETSAGASAFDLESESTMMPCVPAAQTATSKLYEKSLLTQLLKEAVGGNCKTLLISHIPDVVTAKSYNELYQLLKLASRARLVQNTPNKRDLAEKALMSAYMRGLSEMYGQGWLAREEGEKTSVKQKLTQQVPTFVPLSSENEDGRKKILSGSRDSIMSDDIDTAYDQLIDDTSREQRQRNVEMAATALFAAAMKKESGGSGSSEEEQDISDEEDSSSSSGSPSPAKVSATKTTKMKVKIRKKKAVSRKDALKASAKLDSPSSSSLAEQDVTIEALVAILQDPDKGVTRASTAALKDVQVHKDAGALFSGADIVQWMVENIDGVETESDAQILGHVLLEKDAIFHTEGSRVFANATTLFYYAREARRTSKLLSPEEIQALLSANPVTSSNTVTQDSEVGVVEVRDFSDEEGCHSKSDELEINRVIQNAEVKTTKKRKKKRKKSASEKMELTEVEKDQAATSPGHSPTSAVVFTPVTPLSPGGDSGVVSLQEAEENKPEVEASSHTEACEEDQQLRAKIDEEDQQQESTSKPNTVAVNRLPSVKTLENTENYPHPLHMAVAIGKSSGVVRQLVMMFGVDKLDEFKRTPLMFAALGNNKGSSCNTLIECGANINRQDISGLAAIHVACYHGNKAAVSALLSKRAAIDVIDNLGHSAIHWSTVPATSGCLQLLISIAWPELVKHTDRNGLTALHWAIYYDHPQHLKLLLKKFGDLLQLDSKGRTLLIYAIEHQAMQCIKVLMRVNPSLLTFQDANGSSPLHHASVHESADFLLALLNYNLPPRAKQLDINCTNEYQRTPIHCAVAYNRIHNVALLMGKDAMQNVVDNKGKTPLDYAKELENGSSKMVAVLKGGEVSPASQEPANDSATASQKNTQSKSPGKSKVCTVV